ncbi:MAG TPA: hypothetical protein DEB40_08490 [Elusimicrobia bacterium]|nr:hypothetical protein [Elusimicrobiota bacterium]HBT61765.1 hypothetical protein [Elusimicrobiota bacterium]
MSKLCPSCRTKLPDDAAVCPNCPHSFSELETSRRAGVVGVHWTPLPIAAIVIAVVLLVAIWKIIFYLGSRPSEALGPEPWEASEREAASSRPEPAPLAAGPRSIVRAARPAVETEEDPGPAIIMIGPKPTPKSRPAARRK